MLGDNGIGTNREEVSDVKFQKTWAIDQWKGRHWTEISHQFKDYPENIRFISFKSLGVDNQHWAGHYGSKMAKASVTLSFDTC